MSKNKAFTLIELSIALVIIGLIIGGVLVGRDLIRAAELRKVTSDTNTFLTAYYAFRNKYGCIPGDCKTASNFFTGAYNGNGDGLIVWSGLYEGHNVWHHLQSAGLIEGSYRMINSGGSTMNITDFPQTSFAQGIYAVKPTQAHAIPTVSVFGWDTSYMSRSSRPANQSYIIMAKFNAADTRGFSEGVMSALDMRSIDEKVDDGMPQKGKLGAAMFSVNCFTPNSDENAVYANSTDRTACQFIRKFE